MTRLTNKRTALQEATRLLALRPLSEKELRHKLAQKCYESEDVNSAVERLIERGYVDDDALCQRLFSYYADLNYCGLRYILNKIKNRGLKTDCLGEQIAAWHDNESEFERAMILVERRYGSEQQDSEDGKLARMLMAKGFSYDVILKIVKK